MENITDILSLDFSLFSHNNCKRSLLHAALYPWRAKILTSVRVQLLKRFPKPELTSVGTDPNPFLFVTTHRLCIRFYNISVEIQNFISISFSYKTHRIK